MEEDVCFGNKLCAFRSFGIIPKFLYYYLQSPLFIGIFKSKTTGLIGGVSINTIKELFFAVPPLEEQKRIVSYIEDVFNVITLVEKNQNDYSNLIEILKKAILKSAIEGTLVEQCENDEPASVLLERIRAEKKAQLGKKYIDSYIYKGDDNRYYEKNGTETQDITEILPLSIPQSWVWCKIRDLAFVTKLAGFEYTKYIADNLTDTGIPLFKGKNIQNSEIIYEFESWIPETISNELIRSQINKKCILTPYVGTIGNIGIHNREGKFHLGSNVGKIELYPYNVIIEEYLVHYLKSCYGYKELTKYKKATCQDSISIDAIREVYVPIPPLSEQYRIVEKIDFLFSMLKDED